MIPPVVQPGDVFQRVRMPNAAGVAGKYVRIASANGGVAQLEWINNSASDITEGTLSAARLPATAVQTIGSYADPAWVTALAASKITGTFMKSQQHAQTAYLDASSQTFNGSIEVRSGGSTILSLGGGAALTHTFGTVSGGLSSVDFLNTGTGVFLSNGTEVMRLASGAATFNGTVQVNGSELKVSDLATQSVGTIALGDGLSSGKYVGIYRGTIAGAVGGGNVLNLAGFSGIAFTTGAAAFGSQTVVATMSDGVTTIGSADIYRVGRFRTATGGDIDFGLLGGSTIGMQSLDSGGNFQTLRLQPNGGALSVGGAATFNGSVVVNNAGTGRVVYGPDSYIQGNASELQILQLGSGSLYQDFGTSVIFRRTSDFGTMMTLTNGGTLTTRGSVNARYGISIAEAATGDLSWILYRNDGGPTQPLYLLDAANSRAHVYFTPASTDANASTHIMSKLFATQVAEFGKGMVATGSYPHDSFGVPGVISYEYPYTRNFAGDGSGYTWAVSKRTGGVTTDLFTIYDASGDVNIKGNNVHLQGAAGGWGSQYAFKGSSGTNRGGFGAVGTSDTLDYYWIGPSFSAPHVKIDSSGTITKYTTTGFDGTYDSLIRYQALADIASPNKAHEIDGTIISSTASLNVVRIRPYSGGGSGAPVTTAVFRGDLSSEFMGPVTVGSTVTATSLALTNGSNKTLSSYRDGSVAGFYTGASVSAEAAWYMTASEHYFTIAGSTKFNVLSAGTYTTGEHTVTGAVNFGAPINACRAFQDSGNLYLESDGTIFLRDTSTSIPLWYVVNDGRTFSKTNVWHSDSDGSPRILYTGSGGESTFRDDYGWVGSLRGHGMNADGSITWGNARTGNNRGRLTWNTDVAVITSPLNMDITCGGLLQITAPSGMTVSGTAKLGNFTAATLPSAASNAGHECNVTDSSVTTFGATVAGGGSNNVKVRSNGTNWTVTGI